MSALRALRRDYGDAGFSYDASAAEDTLVVTRCLYSDIFTEEAAAQTLPPGLAACTCCSLDAAVWFDLLGDSADGGGAAKGHLAVLRALRPRAAAVRVELTASRARGDAACCMRVTTA